MGQTTVADVLATGESPRGGLGLIAQRAEVHPTDEATTLARALDDADVLFAWDFRSRLVTGAWRHAPACRRINEGSVRVDADSAGVSHRLHADPRSAEPR